MKKIKEKKKKSRILAILKWISLGLFALIFFISISLIAVNNIPFLRKPVLKSTLDIVNSFLIAKIEIGDLKFISHNHIWVKDFKLITAGDTLAQFKKLDVKIKLSGLLENKIIVKYLKLDSPVIKLLRSQKDLKWNFEKIAPPSEPSKTKSKGPIIKIQYLDLKNAKFQLKDSTFVMKSLPFNPLDIFLDELNIRLNADMNLDISKFSANFERISFNELNTQFRVDSLKMSAVLDTNMIDVKYLRMNLPKSFIKLAVKIQDYSPLSKYLHREFDSAKFILSADAIDFNTSTLKKFVYVPFRENIKSDFAMEAIGSSKELQVNKLNLLMRGSELHSKGILKNFTSGKLNYDFTFKNSNIAENDIKTLLNFDLSSIPVFKNAKIKELNAKGDVNHVISEFDFISEIGDMKGNTTVRYSPDFYFQGDIQFNNINLSPILHNQGMNSNLTGNSTFESYGYNPSKMVGFINLNLQNSDIIGRELHNLEANVQMDKGIINIDKIIAEFPENSEISILQNDKLSKLEMGGQLNIKEISFPKYNFEINTTGLNLSKLLQVNQLPNVLTSNIKVNGDGLNPDSLQLNLKAHFDEISFKNLSLLPVDASLDIKSTQNFEKEILLKFGDNFLKIKGTVKTENLAGSISNWIEYASLFFESRSEQFLSKKYDIEKDSRLNKLAKDITIPSINADFSFKFENLSFLNNFVSGLNLNSSIQSNSRIITGQNNIMLDLTDLRIGNTYLTTKGTELSMDAFNFSGVAEVLKKDSSINLSYFEVSLDSLDSIKYNNLLIKKPVTDIFLADSNYIVDFSANIDTMAQAALSLSGSIFRDNILMNFNKLDLNYLNKIKFTNNKVGSLRIDNNSFTLQDFKITGNNNEIIALSGYADTNSFENFVVDISNLQLKNLRYFFPLSMQELLKEIDFHLNNAKLELGGNFSSPTYHFTLNADSIIAKNKQIGFLLADLNYSDNRIYGTTELKNEKQKFPLLKFEVEKFPIDLSLTKNFGNISGDYIAKINLDSFNLQLAEPFIPMVKNVKGTANAQISISGTNEKDFHLYGKANTNDLSFKFLQNYLDYYAQAELSFEDQNILIENSKISNSGLNNFAKIKGMFAFADNSLERMDLNVRAENFIILDENSKAANPQFFGRINVSTKNDGITISGKPSKLNIDGDLQLNQSNLTIANLNSSNVYTKTNFEYVIKDDKRIYTIVTKTDSSKLTNKQKIKVNSSSVPDINLSVFLPKTFNLKINLGTIGEILAIIGTSDPTIPLKYIMGDKNPSGQLFGELLVKDGSTLNSYKTMAATGTITFNTGNLQEPSLNLTARYDGKIDEQTNPIKYSVFIYITGTPQLPKVRFDYTINNMAPQGEQKKIEENALYLLLFGALPGTTGIVDPMVVNKLGNAGISSIASRSMSDLLLKTGVIESADVELNSEDFEKTKIQLKGKLFGTMNWSFGGNVADLAKNNQIIIEIPLSVDSETFNQIVWLISYSTNLNSTTIDPDEKNWEFKFKVGGSW